MTYGAHDPGDSDLIADAPNLPAWVRLTDEEGKVVFEGTPGALESFGCMIALDDLDIFMDGVFEWIDFHGYAAAFLAEVPEASR